MTCGTHASVVIRFDKTPRATPGGKHHGPRHICHRRVELRETLRHVDLEGATAAVLRPRGISVRQGTSCHTRWQTPRSLTHLPRRQTSWPKPERWRHGVEHQNPGPYPLTRRDDKAATGESGDKAGSVQKDHRRQSPFNALHEGPAATLLLASPATRQHPCRGVSAPEGVALPGTRRDHWDDLAREHRARMWIGRQPGRQG